MRDGNVEKEREIFVKNKSISYFLFLLDFLFTFEKVKFPLLMHVKPPDDEGLANLVQQPWWETEGVSFL